MEQQDIVLISGPVRSELTKVVKQVTGDVSVVVVANDYVDEAELTLARYNHLVDLLGEHQHEAARRLIEVARDRHWDALWLSGGSRVMARVGPSEAA